MKVSIITVVYNNVTTIGDAINSVVNQTYKDIEYIIIDGDSKDGTLDIIHTYGNNVSVLVSEPDKGIYDAMNKGILRANGDIIAILNSDDVLADNKVIEDVVFAFTKTPEYDMIYGDLVYVKRNDLRHVVRVWKSTNYYKNYFENGNVPPHTALFIRKKVYDAAGLFSLEFKLAADYEFMLRAFKKFSFKARYYRRLMIRMRLGGATNKSIANIYKGNLEILSSWHKNGLKPPLFLMPLRVFKRLLQFFK